MARKHQAQTAAQAAAGIFLSVVLLGGPARGQDGPATAAAPVMPAPFSRDCHVANDSVIRESPLPNVAAALQKRKTIKILAIGASATSSGHGRRGSYTEQIEQILEQAAKGLDVVMINRGISGELAADAAHRIKTEVALNDPDLLLWQVGTNDALAYVPIDELRTTIVDTIQWLRAHGVDVVLVGLQFVHREAQDDNYRAVRELIRSIGEQEKVVVVRRSEAMRLIDQASGSGGGLFPEEFAQTEAGYACLAEYVARAIALGSFGKSLRDVQRPPGPAPQQLNGAPAPSPR
jgi:lysophospholipase L1-like esterase